MISSKSSAIAASPEKFCPSSRITFSCVVGVSNDVLAPSLAGAIISLSAIGLLVSARFRPDDPKRQAPVKPGFVIQLIVLLAAVLLIMRWTGPLLFEEHRSLRDTMRWKLAGTYGQIALIDHQVGRLMIALQDAGLDENTLVIYISDHGDWLGDHGLILKGPMHYEGLLRVPMIWSGPGVPKGKVIDDPVSTLDLGPTFLDYADASELQTQHGVTLRPLIEADTASRDFAINEWELLPTRAGVALSLRTVRTKTHKLTIDLQSGAGELYDLENDPNELVNLFDSKNAQPVRQVLEAMLHSRPDDMRHNQTQVGMA